MNRPYRRFPGPVSWLAIVLALCVAFWILVGWFATATFGAGLSPSTEVATPVEARGSPAPRRCESGRRAVSFYRQSTWRWQQLRGAHRLADRTPLIRHRSCRWVDRALAEWVGRSKAARGRYEVHLRRLRDPDYAIELVFRSHSGEAKEVAACESGDKDGDLSPHVVRARNGQYLGMFQMGSWERSRYGHGSTPYSQAVAAHRYFVASGGDWSPWACRPANGRRST